MSNLHLHFTVFLSMCRWALHIWVGLPFLLEDPLKPSQIGCGVSVNCDLTGSPQVFHRVQVWPFGWATQGQSTDLPPIHSSVVFVRFGSVVFTPDRACVLSWVVYSRISLSVWLWFIHLDQSDRCWEASLWNAVPSTMFHCKEGVSQMVVLAR